MTNRRPPTEEEIDRLLASRLADTTPEFEARFRDLQRELRQATARRLPWWREWRVAGLGLALAGAAALVLLLRAPSGPGPHPGAAEFSPEFVQLLEADDLLSRAAPLLDAANRELLLKIPEETPES